MATLQQEKYIKDILKHDFDTWYEYTSFAIKRDAIKEIIMGLNFLDAVLTLEEDLGYTLGGGYYDMDNLDQLVNKCSGEILFKSNIRNRYEIEE